MDSITLQNYRCFGSEEQTARLAPLTLLVGPNSTGKTSFLALIRALWDVAFREVVPNFREEPFDLGSFDDIAYRLATRGGPCAVLRCTFSYAGSESGRRPPVSFDTTFVQRGGFPFPSIRTIAAGDSAVTIESTDDTVNVVRFRSRETQIDRRLPGEFTDPLSVFPFSWFSGMNFSWGITEQDGWKVELDSEQLESVIIRLRQAVGRSRRPFAGAPTRSRPRRTYDPIAHTPDAEGNSTPSYLASLARHNVTGWRRLQGRLEDYGRDSELFDEIDVRLLGTSDGDPFQMQVRKHSGPKSRRRKGPWRNLIDMGYGVSQALPVVVEMLRPDAAGIFLLQQPEVHLHPKAQAALGTLFGQVAAGGRQLVVETHSDHIIDRVRMDVRDQTTGLKPEDVSILYFEPRDLDVKIHSIRLDEMGNVLDAPPGYRKFFMEEMRRSIGL